MLGDFPPSRAALTHKPTSSKPHRAFVLTPLGFPVSEQSEESRHGQQINQDAKCPMVTQFLGANSNSNIKANWVEPLPGIAQRGCRSKVLGKTPCLENPEKLGGGLVVSASPACQALGSMYKGNLPHSAPTAPEYRNCHSTPPQHPFPSEV